VDNLPVVLLERFLELFRLREERLAVVMDTREGSFLAEFPKIHDRLRVRGVPLELLFLDAADEVLLKRFDETRRVHPAVRESPVAGIARERELLAPVAERADVVIDTSELSVHELKRFVVRHYSGAERSAPLVVNLVSFGFRHGAPEVADLMIDVRFLPNPNFEPRLRDRTGLDAEVAAFVLEGPPGREFRERLFGFVDYLLPLYENEGKAYLTLALGCTGGQHRSVAVVTALERHLRERKIEVRVLHRDAEKSRRAES
jgi:UPF0042 nucleotide-binding protein